MTPILLLHGLGTSAARTWGDNGWLDLLSDEGRQVIAPDLLGHGTAPRPHEPGAYDEIEATVARQLDEAAGPGTAVDAIGFSMGARTLLHLAIERPERFRRLVLAGVGANLFRESSEAGVRVLAAVLDDPRPPEDPMLAYLHRLAYTAGNDPAALAALLRRPGGPRLTDEGLARITCPVLVVLGDADRVGPADPLVERLTGAPIEVRILPGTDHAATPKSFAFIEAALAFLTRSPAG